ncbi:hypothetical protein PG989_002268 [Apiospora arundinis]
MGVFHARDDGGTGLRLTDQYQSAGGGLASPEYYLGLARGLQAPPRHATATCSFSGEDDKDGNQASNHGIESAGTSTAREYFGALTRAEAAARTQTQKAVEVWC